MTLTLLLTVAVCALLDSLSPATIGIVAYLLIAGTRPVGARIAVYLGTVAILYFALGVVLMSGLGPLLAAVENVMTSRPVYWAQLVIGVALFALAFWIGSARFKARPRRQRTVPAGTAAMIGLGLGTVVLEAGLALPYFAAIGLMTTAGLSAVEWLPILAGYVVIMIAPALLMVAADAVLGERIRPHLEALRGWIERNSAETLSWIVGIVGFLLARDAAAVLFFNDADMLPPDDETAP